MPRKLIGDQVKAALDYIGITEEIVTDWIGKPCNCSETRAKLNQLHLWALQAPARGKQSAIKYLHRIIGANEDG